jgi:AraC-like DNA-binding protein
MNYVYAASSGLIFIFIFLIFRKENKSTADYLLIGINVLIGCFMLADVFIHWKLTSETVIFQNGIPLLLLPTFVWYVLQFTHTNRKIHSVWYVLFLPALIFLVLSAIDHYLLLSYDSEQTITEHFNAPTIWYQLIFKGSQLLFIGILIWLLKTLNSFNKRLKVGYSDIETVNLRWLKHFTWIYLSTIIITFILFLSQNVGLLPLDINQVFGIIYGILVFSVFYLNFQGIQHYTLSQVYPSKINNPILPAELVNEKHTKNSSSNESRFLNEEEKAIEIAILSVIESEKLYLEPKFNLEDLATSLKRSKHKVSKIINAKENRSFYDLINGYRVTHLQKMLDNPKNLRYTILTLGLESGFNSKASLNRIFKNSTGLTPKQYLDITSQSIV